MQQQQFSSNSLSSTTVITLATCKDQKPQPDLHMPVLTPEAQELCEPGVPQYVCICAHWLPKHTQFIQLLHPAWLQKACKQNTTVFESVGTVIWSSFCYSSSTADDSSVIDGISFLECCFTWSCTQLKPVMNTFEVLFTACMCKQAAHVKMQLPC